MSAFYGAPAGPHIGRCQNFITPQSAAGYPPIRSAGGYYCMAPVLGLGGALADDRDICGGCWMRTEAFRQRVTDQFVAGLDAEAARIWLKGADRVLADITAGYFERAARRASMVELFKIRREIERRQALIDAVLAAFPPPVATSQSLL